MNASQVHLRHCALYEYRKGNTAASAARNICEVYGEHILDTGECERWYERFREDVSELPDQPRSNRSLKFDEETSRAPVDLEPRLTTEEITGRPCSSNENGHQRLAKIGKVTRIGKWAPGELSVAKCIQRVNVRATLRDQKCTNFFAKLFPTMKNGFYTRISNGKDSG